MGDPSTSKHVSGRRARTRQPEPEGEDAADNFREAMRVSAEKRNAAKNKNLSAVDKATHENILKFLQENNQRKKVTSSNCFETKTPLDMFNVEDMVKSNCKIQDMAIVLDSSQQIYSARVDRLFADVRGVQMAMTKGEFENPKNGENQDDEAAKQKRKKKNPESGIAEMEEALKNMGEDGDENQEENEEEEEVRYDDLDYAIEEEDWDDNLDDAAFDKKVQEMIDHQAAVCERQIFSNASSHVVTDSRSLEIQNTDIDWLKTNPYYQKAMVGSADDVTSSFHSLLSNGIYSDDGRTFKLHPRVLDPAKEKAKESKKDSAKDRPTDGKTDSPKEPPIDHKQMEKSARNIRKLACNAMLPSPFPIYNNFVLEVENRPRTGQYRLAHTTKKTVVPRPTAMSSQDTTVLREDLTVMIPIDRDLGSVGPSTLTQQDMTLFGASSPQEMESMNTESSGPVTTRMNSAITESGALRASEFELLPYDDILMDDEVDLPITDYFETKGLERILDLKVNAAEEDDESKKVWRRGILAEEWDDDCSDMTRECQVVMKAGIDSYVKALDHMVNTDVVKMIFKKETIAKLDSEYHKTGSIEGSSTGSKNRPYPTVPDRYFILKKSDAYKTMYPPDTKGHFVPIKHKDDSIPIAIDDNPCADEPMEEEEEVYSARDGNNSFVFNENLARNADNDDNGAMDHGALGGEDDHVAEAFYGGGHHETVEPVENFAVDAEDVPDLMANLVTEPPVGGIRPEMQAEIQNLGKEDNAHWKGAAAVAAESASNVNKKRKERKIRKKITVDDFSHYFEPLTEADKVEKTTEMLCKQVKNTPWILKESQILMPEIPKESKPFIAFEFEALSRSGLMFRKKYGKLRFERCSQKRSANDDMFIEDASGNVDSDCLNWLLSFSGFRCLDQDATSADNTMNDNDHYGGLDDNNFYDDRDEEHDQNYLRQEAMMKMSESTSQKFMNVARETDNMRLLYNKLNRHHENNYDNEENDDDVDDFYGQNSAHRAKNLDAAKHKKCIAEVLNSALLTTPNIVLMVEKLSDGTLSATGEIRTDAQSSNESTSSAHDVSALESVYRFKVSPDQIANIDEIIGAFSEPPDYTANGGTGSAAIDPANPPVEPVHVVGVKTFTAVVMCAPSKMDESPNPAALLSFTLHLANENGLQLVQDKRSKNWMNDFIFLNKGEKLPDSVEISGVSEEEMKKNGILWTLHHDPFARMATPDTSDDEDDDDEDGEEDAVDEFDFDDNEPGPSTRPPRGADKRANRNLSQIFEDDEEEEEGEENDDEEEEEDV